MKIKVQPIPKNFAEELERITDSGQAVFASPVENETDKMEIRKSMIEIIRNDKAKHK